MSKQLRFDLDIANSALLQANSEAFYSKAYLTEETVDNYRTLPGIKAKTKISNVVFGQPSYPLNDTYAVTVFINSQIEI